MIVGVDLSLVSPGICVIVNDTDIRLAAFPQRVRERGLSLKVDDKTTVTMMDHVDKNGTDMERYVAITDGMIEYITKVSEETKQENVSVFVEGYSFPQRSQAGSSYKLRELGGILKYRILRDYPTWTMTTAPIGAWKKAYTGKGNAKKGRIYKRLTELVGDIYTPMGFTKPLPTCTTDNEWDVLKVPSPVEDMSDALGIAYAQFKPLVVEKKKLKRKRKHAEDTVKEE